MGSVKSTWLRRERISMAHSPVRSLNSWRPAQSQCIPVIKKDMVLEGGSVHLDGEG